MFVYCFIIVQQQQYNQYKQRIDIIFPSRQNAFVSERKRRWKRDKPTVADLNIAFQSPYTHSLFLYLHLLLTNTLQIFPYIFVIFNASLFLHSLSLFISFLPINHNSFFFLHTNIHKCLSLYNFTFNHLHKAL